MSSFKVGFYQTTLKRLTVIKTGYENRRNSTILLFHNYVKSLLIQRRKLKTLHWRIPRNEKQWKYARIMRHKIVLREKFITIDTQERIRIN